MMPLWDGQQRCPPYGSPSGYRTSTTVSQQAPTTSSQPAIGMGRPKWGISAQTRIDQMVDAVRSLRSFCFSLPVCLRWPTPTMRGWSFDNEESLTRHWPHLSAASQVSPACLWCRSARSQTVCPISGFRSSWMPGLERTSSVWLLLIFGAFVSLLNFHLSFTLPLYRHLRHRESRVPSGFPLIGQLLCLLSLPFSPTPSVPQLIAIIAALLDTGGIHWFIVAMLRDRFGDTD